MSSDNAPAALTAEQRAKALCDKWQLPWWHVEQDIAAAIRDAEDAAARAQVERDCAAVCPYCFGDKPSAFELVFQNGKYRHPCKCHVPDDWEPCKGDKIRRDFAAAHAPRTGRSNDDIHQK